MTNLEMIECHVMSRHDWTIQIMQYIHRLNSNSLCLFSSCLLIRTTENFIFQRNFLACSFWCVLSLMWTDLVRSLVAYGCDRRQTKCIRSPALINYPSHTRAFHINNNKNSRSIAKLNAKTEQIKNQWAKWWYEWKYQWDRNS